MVTTIHRSKEKQAMRLSDFGVCTNRFFKKFGCTSLSTKKIIKLYICLMPCVHYFLLFLSVVSSTCISREGEMTSLIL